MNKEEYFKRMINRICKDYGYDAATTFEGLYLEKIREIDRLNEELGDASYTITQLHKVMDRHYVEKEDYDRLNNIRIKALEYIYKDLVRKNVNWDYDDVIGSDLPAEAIKPLVDILEGNENEKDESDAL